MSMELINDPIYVGTELKILVELEAPGFDMEDDDFTVTLKGRKLEKVFQKQDLVTDGEGHWYCCFDTEEFGAGAIQIIVTALVPDDDFEDGTRKEIQKFNLLNVLR